jgi:hypothetical protein
MRKFWKKKEPVSGQFPVDIPMAVIARWYFYDAGLEDPNKLSTLIGMLPVSVEGDEKEEEDSDQRLLKVMPLMPFIETITEINARSIAALQFDHYITNGQLEADDLSVERTHIEELYRQVSHSALLSAFASGLELGIISTDTIEGDISYE